MPVKFSPSAILFCLILSGLSSCSLWQPLPDIGLTGIPSNLKQHQISSLIEWKSNSSHQFIAVLAFEEKKATLVAVNSNGLKLFSLVQELGKPIVVETNFLTPKGIEPELFYKDLLFSYASEDFIEQQLSRQPSEKGNEQKAKQASSHWQLQKKQFDNNKLRLITYNAQPWISIQYSQDALQQACQPTQALITRLTPSADIAYQFQLSCLEVEPL